MYIATTLGLRELPMPSSPNGSGAGEATAEHIYYFPDAPPQNDVVGLDGPKNIVYLKSHDPSAASRFNFAKLPAQ